MPRLQINDLLEILIIAVLLYVFMVWIFIIITRYIEMGYFKC